MSAPTQSLPVFRAADFLVTNGANLGDPLAEATELSLDDIYSLSPRSERVRLAVSEDLHSQRFEIACGTEVGVPGNQLHLDCLATFMSPDGVTTEIIILVETDEGLITATYMLPLAPIETGKDYALVTVDREAARARLAEFACVSFSKGTLITLSNGEQRPIEELRRGDRVLTRDNGAQEIRWIGQQTVRATGAFAPIVITKGTLNNSNDLMVSPNHRLFIYQRRHNLEAGRAEVLIKAKLLVNGETVVQSDGGFVDYYQLLFDRHEIIYAEGIAAESLFVDTRVKAVIPPEVSARMRVDSKPSVHSRALDVNEGTLDSAIAAELLRRSSTY